MLKLHRIPESSRREGPEPVSRDFPLIVSRALPEFRVVRTKVDPRPAAVLNTLSIRDAKHRERRFSGAEITGWGSL